ncbi:cobalamin biosynthesis protein CbiB [Corticibacter populi]|uniref:Cobalamin biosynthesis protein CbiB n=1 Tax=Corticibacter populi TaxID=1550736 RepID=A0A3M6R108_9BURK|nr:cobalamin biosynthesis protein CbiB [Corticibacter populi]RMX08579.1 cobalamin biosynthesis protein CbiB [Corticibacter populi]RZS35903.1 adenosylcobinamide-phosphate synthase [Corticibacter populi]
MVLAIFFALLLEQLRPLEGPRSIARSLRHLMVVLRRSLDAGAGWQAALLWALVAAGPALLSWLVYALLLAWLGWFAAFVWTVGVLAATLGFRSFSLHFTRIRNALSMGDEGQAAAALLEWQQLLRPGQPAAPWMLRRLRGEALVAQTIKVSLLYMHRHVFGVFAAFGLLAPLGLGPAGAVLLRCAEYAYRQWSETYPGRAAEARASPALNRLARQAWAVVDAVPVRCSALVFAAVGRFEEALGAWRAHRASSPDDAEGALLGAAVAAMGLPRAAFEWPGLGALGALGALVRLSATERIDDALDDSEAKDVLDVQALHDLATLIWRALLLWGGLLTMVLLLSAVL